MVTTSVLCCNNQKCNKKENTRYNIILLLALRLSLSKPEIFLNLR